MLAIRKNASELSRIRRRVKHRKLQRCTQSIKDLGRGVVEMIQAGKLRTPESAAVTYNGRHPLACLYQQYVQS